MYEVQATDRNGNEVGWVFDNGADAMWFYADLLTYGFTNPRVVPVEPEYQVVQ
jgi:hypothetical protein